MNWCILIPLLVGLISALLGYLLGRFLGGSNHDDCNDKIRRLEKDLEACRKAKTQLDTDLASAKSSLSNSNVASSFAAPAAVAAIAFDADAAKAVFGKRIKENDLTIVEGIGPKIQELFHNHDVKTWKALSECSVDKCQSVLNSGGDRYKIHKPGTWPEQAKMAYEGRWEDLLKWQDELDGGK
ncbi:hypothetical protein [uncultured Winogradskyella sp.]|uniref:hypothetical protein n=1 Tax=uncultured Winogradskyella sp. TaxID=395353 RepID=UPI0026223586|nr:hypothetical protein [uncultured Winogradskyella sp.]